MSIIDYVVVGLYLLLTLYIGIQQGKKIKDFRDYAVGDYTFSTSVLFATVAATEIGGMATLGVAEKVFSMGVIFVLIRLGHPVHQLIISEYIIPRMGRFKGMVSLGEIMESFYGKPARFITGFLCVLKGTGTLSAQVFAIGHVFHHFLLIPEWIGMVLGSSIIVFYSTLGGVRSVTITDVIQFALLIVTIPLVCTVGLQHVGGFEGLLAQVPAEKFVIFDDNWLNNIGIFIAFSIPFMDPPTTQRILMANNWRQAQLSFRRTGVIGFPFFFIIGTIALISVVLKPDLNPNLALPYIITEFLPIGLKGFAIAGLLAVIMSTADSYLNATSVAFVNDFVNVLSKKKLSLKKELRIAKITTLVMGIGAIGVALFSKSITNIVLASWNVWGPIILVPSLAGIFGYRASPRTFYITAASGVIIFLLWHFGLTPLIGLSALVPSIFLSAVVFFLSRHFGDRISRNAEDKHRPVYRARTVSLNLKQYKDLFVQRMLERRAPYQIFAIFMLINNLLPYLIMDSPLIGTDLSITLRVVSSIMCLFLLVWDFEVQKPETKAWIWYSTLLLSLPLMSVYFLMIHGANVFWTLNSAVCMVVLLCLVDWPAFILISLLGASLGTGLSLFTPEGMAFLNSDWKTFILIVYAFISMILVGALLTYKYERVQSKRLSHMKVLAGAIAHELRTPLSSIAMKSKYMESLLKRDKLSAEEAGYLEDMPQDITNVVRSAQTLIDMTLAKFRDVSHHPLDKISAKEIVGSALESFPFEANEKNLVHLSVQEDFLFHGHVESFKYVLYNLLKNSLYFIHAKGKGEIFIDIIPDIRWNKIIVKDTGQGIARRRLKKIFDQFYTRRDNGTGIGLAYCKSTIENFGGTIACESIEGEQTTFIISFPTIDKINEIAA